MEGRYLSLSLFIYSNKGLFLIVSLISLTSWRVFIIISNLSHDLQVHGLMLLNAPPIWWFVKNISSILLSALQTRSARGTAREGGENKLLELSPTPIHEKYSLEKKSHIVFKTFNTLKEVFSLSLILLNQENEKYRTNWFYCLI